MGIAGGLVPSPSALLVLLAAVALDRVGFGLALIVSYGVGLALTLIAAGLLMARLEHAVRRVAMRTSGGAIATAVSALPLVSAVGLICGGALFVLRALQV
jgi:nickel/cobalt transporter (NicO) family protein